MNGIMLHHLVSQKVRIQIAMTRQHATNRVANQIVDRDFRRTDCVIGLLRASAIRLNGRRIETHGHRQLCCRCQRSPHPVRNKLADALYYHDLISRGRPKTR